MKGTCRADSISGSRRQAALQKLLADEKELAEHHTVVDLLRNDLSLVADKVRVSQFRCPQRILTSQGDLWTTSSTIEGYLPQNWPSTIGSLIRRLLPAGSVTGAPKRRTVELLSSLETSPRHFYTGVSGVFTGQSFHSQVLIRTIQSIGAPNATARLWYHSGAGITVYSDPASEYDEVLAKIYLPV